MNVFQLVSAISLMLVLLAACAGPVQPAGDVSAPVQEADAVEAVDGVASSAADSALLLETLDANRAVRAGVEDVFNFKMVNTTGQAMPVVVILERASGQRWRTSLCVEKLCLLGDGSKPSITDPVVLPPYLEQQFKVQLFVDEAARPGQQAAWILRVEPQTGDAMSQNVTLRAQVASP